jgi:regulator of cell morphogenesis and NO signaling
MDHLKTEVKLELGSHPYFQFNAAIERLEEEHKVLSASLEKLCKVAATIDHKKHIANWIETMLDLKQRVSEFKKALMLHSNWEEDELFKLVDKYFEEIPSLFGLIEQEHELAEQFMDAFILVVDQNILAKNPLDVTKMVAYLQLAHNSLVGHFKKEEDIVASLADFSNQYGY